MVSVRVCVCVCVGTAPWTVSRTEDIHTHTGLFYRPSTSPIDLATFGPTTDPHPIHTTAAWQESVHSLITFLPPLQARRVYGQSWGYKSLSPLSGIWSPCNKRALVEKTQSRPVHFQRGWSQSGSKAQMIVWGGRKLLFWWEHVLTDRKTYWNQLSVHLNIDQRDLLLVRRWAKKFEKICVFMRVQICMRETLRYCWDADGWEQAVLHIQHYEVMHVNFK